jgi:kinetochore protein Spc7/SPC105
VLEEINKKAQEVLPGLRAEYEQVMRELEQEEAEVAEIENCDQDYLKELKTSIAEQRFVVLHSSLMSFC